MAASMESNFTDLIVGVSARGKPIDFSSGQLQLLQEIFEAGFGSIAKTVAEHIGALEACLPKLEGDPHLDQRVAATSGVKEACHAGSSKTRSRRLRRVRTKNKYTYSKAQLLSLLPATSLQNGRHITGIDCSKEVISLDRTRREVLCLEQMILDHSSNICEKRTANDEVVRHLQPSSDDGQWCDVVNRLAAIESGAVNASMCQEICTAVLDEKLHCVLELMKEFNEESRSAVRSQSLAVVEHVGGVITRMETNLLAVIEHVDATYWERLFNSLRSADFERGFQHVLA